MISVIFSPINSINIDLVALFYDLATAFLTGYIVWYKTDEFMLRRDERESYKREQQEYSRYLGRICRILDSFRGPNDALRTLALESIEDAPVRDTFKPNSPNQASVFAEISDIFLNIRNDIGFEDHTIDVPQLKRHAASLGRLRVKILAFELVQPKVNPFHLVGKPATTANKNS